jgi:hypothetical protein
MSSKAFTAKVFRWLHQVNEDVKLAASCTKVAVRLSPDFNEEQGGMAWSACKTMADDICTSKATVINAVRAMQARGHLRVEWGKPGRGHSNHYWMVEPADLSEAKKGQQADLFEEEKRSNLRGRKGQSAKRKGQSTSRKGQPVDLTLSIPIDQPSRDSSTATDRPPDRSARKKRRTSGEAKTSAKSASSASGQKEKEGIGARAAGGGAAFDRFWAVYPRRVAKEAARKAFAAAIKRGADPEALIAGAQRYAVERQGQPRRYTKHPATWLNGGCWEDEPPGTAVIDEQGNVVAFERPEDEEESDDVYSRYLEMANIAYGGKSW